MTRTTSCPTVPPCTAPDVAGAQQLPIRQRGGWIRRVRLGAVTAVVIAALLIVVDDTAAQAAGPAAAVHQVHQVGVLAVNDLPTIVNNLRNWIMGILAALATLFLTIGAARYVMAGGDPSEVERAKAAFRSAATGYVLAVIAPVVLAVLKSIIGG